MFPMSGNEVLPMSRELTKQQSSKSLELTPKVIPWFEVVSSLWFASRC